MKLTVSVLNVAVLAWHLNHSRRQLQLLGVEQRVDVGDASLVLWNVSRSRGNGRLGWTSGNVWRWRFLGAGLVLPGGR